MMIVRIIFGFAVVLAGLTSAFATSKGPTLQDKQEAACADDAKRLCGDDIPDVEKVTACMKSKKAQVSAACAKMFDQAK